MSLTYTVMADTIGRVMHNATTAQQSMQTIGTASTTTVCALIVAAGMASQG